jgi:hypothetical protein
MINDGDAVRNSSASSRSSKRDRFVDQGQHGVEDLEATRAELRSLIAPDSIRRRRGGEFPRSAIMRTVLKPELRWVWVGGLSLLTILASRRLPVGKLNPWLLALTSLRGALRNSREY